MQTEVREFVNAFTSPEDQAADKAYFESKGIEYETTSTEEVSPATEEPSTAATPPKVEQAKAEEPTVDAETEAEWKAAENDGKRKSSYANLRAKIREQKEATAAAEQRTHTLEEEIAKLRKPAEVAVETFADPEPEAPNPADYDEAHDPRAAFSKAQADFTKQWNRWDRKRESFEADQQRKKADAAKPVEPAVDPRLIETVNTRLAEARAAMPDFDETVVKNPGLNDAIRSAAMVVPDGLALLHRMIKSHPDKFSKLQQSTLAIKMVNGNAQPTDEANNMAMFLLGQFAGVPAVVTPPQPQPKERELTPRSVRGRTVINQQRLEDITNVDERRYETARRLAAGEL